MATTLEELEDRVTKRREIDMIVKMRVDQLQRENIFVPSSQLDALLRVAENAIEKAAALETRIAALEAQLASFKE